MCIAIIKPIGIELPSKERLKTCFDNNPHSVGFAIGDNDANTKEIYKFLNFDNFYEKAKMYIHKNCFAFIHFRYATHGKINLNNCQPFFINNKNLDIQNASVLMHNGVFQLGKLENNKSDTLTLVEKIYNEHIKLDNDIIIQSNNKVAIWNNNFNCKLYGRWIEENDGCYYSNGSFRKNVEEYKKKYQNNNLTFCDCCGEIGNNHLTTEVGYHFCDDCIKNKKVYLYNCSECGQICADKICSKCSEEKNISLKYWK